KHDRTPPAPPIEAIGPAPAPPADKTTVKMTGVFEAADLEAGAVRKSRVQRLKPAASKALEADEAAACENLKRNHPELLALKAFESRGGDAIEWFFLAPSGKRSGEYHRCTIDEYFDLLWGGLMREAERLGVSLVARVRGGYNIEFDDCDPATVKLLRPFGFLDYETSEANSHCWIGLKDAEDREAVRDRLFARLKEIGSPANPGASGSTRWPGSINFKPGRNLFRVRIGHVALGRFTTPAELEEAGLLAISRPTPSPPPRPPILINAGDDWPNYQQCIEHQTKKGKEHPGLADALFVHRAFLRRHTAQEIAEMLMRISPKAKERGREYVDRTIANSLKHLKKEGWIINDS
ncbi:MAG: hypothetical protein J2P41_00660, partial [Blastocatellia bacterium]|nr:hypothetical protein [Blastocatellia bacterium]